MTESFAIPTYAMLDVWTALGGDPAAFDRMLAEDRRTPADTWAQLMTVIRGNLRTLLVDTNPPVGPEFVDLIAGLASGPLGRDLRTAGDAVVPEGVDEP